MKSKAQLFSIIKQKYSKNSPVSSVKEIFNQSIAAYKQEKISIGDLSDICEILMGNKNINSLLMLPNTELIIHFADVNYYLEKKEANHPFVLAMIKHAKKYNPSSKQHLCKTEMQDNGLIHSSIKF